MALHYWGDEGVDWAGISDAAAYIGLGLRRWGRINVWQYGEKYGTALVSCSLGFTSLNQLTHPGYCYNQWPKWAFRLTFTWAAHILVRTLNLFFYPYHLWLYKHYYRKAREKWPHLAQEIYRGADWYELIGAKVKVTQPNGGGIIWWPEWDQEPEE